MKILLIRVSSMGDVLHNMPVASDLHQYFPEAQIDWVVEEAFVPLVQLHPAIHKVIPFALRRWRKSLSQAETRAEIRGFFKELRRERYDLILETQGLFKTGLILGAALATSKSAKWGLANGTEGSGYEGISRLFHHHSVAVEKRTHAVARGRQVAAAAALAYSQQHQRPLPHVAAPAVFALNPPASRPACLPEGDYLVFFHGTAGPAKKWAVANWRALAEYAGSLKLPVLLPWGSAAEQQAAQEIAAGIANVSVLPKLSMMEAIALAYHAKVAIGVDTGLTHIAAAYNKPTIEIYCASPRWKTEGNWSDNIINLGDAGEPPDLAEVQQALQSLITTTT